MPVRGPCGILKRARAKSCKQRLSLHFLGLDGVCRVRFFCLGGFTFLAFQLPIEFELFLHCCNKLVTEVYQACHRQSAPAFIQIPNTTQEKNTCMYISSIVLPRYNRYMTIRQTVDYCKNLSLSERPSKKANPS